jgi:hypothetical protein
MHRAEPLIGNRARDLAGAALELNSQRQLGEIQQEIASLVRHYFKPSQRIKKAPEPKFRRIFHFFAGRLTRFGIRQEPGGVFGLSRASTGTGSPPEEFL